MSASRDIILGRIREALRRPAPAPGAHGGHAAPHPPGTASDWLPAVGETAEARMELFAANAADLKAVLVRTTGPEAAGRALSEIAAAEGWRRIATHAGVLCDAVAPVPGLPVMKTDGGYDVEALEACDAGVTECDALVAQTGSVVLTARSGGGRALSVLPPHHVVLARESQLVADLPAAFALLQARYGDAYPSFMTFITGPSRTGDIERILVLGAHGPKKLTIITVPDAPASV